METQVPACPRYPVAKFDPGFIPPKFLEYLEHNQKIASCCRHPENHDIEARKSHPSERFPDIYIFHCTCGRQHRIFCVGAKNETLLIKRVHATTPEGPERERKIAAIREASKKDIRPYWTIK